MDNQTYEKYIQGFLLLDCAVGDRDNIAFGMKQDIGLDVHPQPGRDETAARLLSYAPKRLPHQGGFGRVEWAYGVMALYPAYDLAARTIIACDTEFEAWETGRVTVHTPALKNTRASAHKLPLGPWVTARLGETC